MCVESALCLIWRGMCFYVDNMADYVRQLQRFNVGEDCPVFDGLYEYCQIYASGSIGKK